MKKNHNTAIIAAIAVVSIALLAGCRELPGKEAADAQLEQRLSGKSHETIAETAKQELGQITANVEQAVQNTAVKVTQEINSRSMSKELTASLKSGSASVLSLDNPIGNVQVTSAKDDTVTVKATVATHNVSTHETSLEILDNAEVSIETSGDKLTVSTHAKDNPNKSLWTWAQKKFGSSDISIDYEIGIPDSIYEYQIINNMGAIGLQDLKGTFHIVSNVGSIHLENARVSGKSAIKSDTGSIRLDINEMDPGSSLNVKSEIGKITAAVSSNLKCTVEASSQLGRITGTSKGKKDFNGGGPLLSLSTQIGSIAVQN
ncbi:hypothetical protein [Paenibacillus sp. HW567]|uniref:hypothetical protein n=1 Tax=Paenibacillus sp. HW567 TaxID=1034769 RepID=UPI000374B16F|nr:hypothetical protein [Paenibacillus sp. HW567]